MAYFSVVPIRESNSMQTTVTPGSGPEASKLAIKLVEWNYGPVCKVRYHEHSFLGSIIGIGLIFSVLL